MKRTLLRDITAADLAMDSADPDEGYQPGHVVGPSGSEVTLTGDDDGDDYIEVTDFTNDPYACGFVPRDALSLDDDA